MKMFYCRCCNKMAEGTADNRFPAGWYSIARSWPGNMQGVVKLGLFCSVQCIDNWMNELYADEAIHTPANAHA